MNMTLPLLIALAWSLSSSALAEPDNEANSKLSKRAVQEQSTENLEFVITPHRRNYLLPASYQKAPNHAPWVRSNTYAEDSPFDSNEIKLQLSFKVPLLEDDLITEGDGLYFGFTMRSFWQAYNRKISAPFRETNYRPEMFYQAPIASWFERSNMFMRIGFEHESNGRSQLLSRSWNRVFLGLGLHRHNWAIYLQPWYRLPEDPKLDDGDPDTLPPAKGDDNPDINRYMGYYELYAAYQKEKYQIATMIRSNTASHKGAIELSYSFPLYGKLKGMVQYFDGYGESMIDYDYRVQRISLGILLTGIL